MPLDILQRKSRVERLREIKDKVEEGESFSAFDLAVEYDISVNVVYRDVKTLRELGAIKDEWQFSRKERGG